MIVYNNKYLYMEINMQKAIDISFFDWSRSSKPVVLARGMTALIPQQLNKKVSLPKENSRYVWPSEYDNTSSRYLSRRIRCQ